MDPFEPPKQDGWVTVVVTVGLHTTVVFFVSKDFLPQLSVISTVTLQRVGEVVAGGYHMTVDVFAAGGLKVPPQLADHWIV